MLAKGPWLVTLHKAPNGAWQVTSRDDLKKFYLTRGWPRR